jgi:hypothetical protein
MPLQVLLNQFIICGSAVGIVVRMQTEELWFKSSYANRFFSFPRILVWFWSTPNLLVGEYCGILSRYSRRWGMQLKA